MKKIFKVLLISFGSIAAACILLLGASALIYSPEYLYRCIVNGESKISDYTFFPAREIEKSENPYIYEYDFNETLCDRSVSFAAGKKPRSQQLEALLEQNGTTSFIVVRNDKVVCEKYFNGHNKNSIETSFSSVKSLVSLMIGIAIEDGYIGSVQDTIADYIPELAGTKFEDITIESLLLMRSEIKYAEGFLWFTDDAKTYYCPDLRGLVLNDMNIDPDYRGRFHYNNYHPLILGMILERSTGINVADYFQTKIWDKVGAEFDASWSLDSEKSGFEKMESGLNFIATDYAKIGSMLLHKGEWNGNSVISQEWIERSTVAPHTLTAADIDGDFLKGVDVGYQYMWYSIQTDSGYDYFSAGKYGQYIYISPESNTVIVRTGQSKGVIDWWPDIFKQIAHQSFQA